MSGSRGSRGRRRSASADLAQLRSSSSSSQREIFQKQKREFEERKLKEAKEEKEKLQKIAEDAHDARLSRMLSKLSYPVASPSKVVGTLVQGLVSHIEFPYLWLQGDPDGIAALCSGVNEEAVHDEFRVGDCVNGRWEGEWCRGQVVKEDESGIYVNFVDWGNTEFLARADVRKSLEGDMTKEVGALKCRIIDGEKVSLEEKLEGSGYMIRLRCVAVYDNVFLVSNNVDLTTLPMSEDIPCEFSEFSQERKCAYFLPLSLRDNLDNLDAQLDSQASSLPPLSTSDMFHGQMCGARFSDDGAIYRAKITTVKVDMAEVIYIDHGNSEWRNMGDLYKLPDQFLTPCPYVVTLDIERCRKLVLSESGVVVKLANVQGELIATKSVEDNGQEMCEEVEVIKQMIHLEQEKLPMGQKVLVSVGCVESVDKVWVTPHKNDGIVKQIELKLAYYESNRQLLRPKHDMKKGDIGVTTFSEDFKLYRFQLEEGNTVRFVDYGNSEEKVTRDFYELPKDLVEFPAGSICVVISHKVAVENTEENLNVIDNKLNQENVHISVEDGIATFYHGEERIVFFKHEKQELYSMKGNIIEVDFDENEDNQDSDDSTAESPSKCVGLAFGVGDEVNFWSTENKRWSKGVVYSLEEGTVKVQGNLGDIHEVEPRNLKSPGIPFEALNQVEVELEETTFEGDANRDQVDKKFDVGEPKPTFTFPSPQVSKHEVEFEKQNTHLGKSDKVKSNETTVETLNNANFSSNRVTNHNHGLNINAKTFVMTPPAKNNLPAVFHTTKDMRQKIDDWISGCLKMLEDAEEEKSKKENTCKAGEDENKNVINEVLNKTVGLKNVANGCKTETIEAFVEEIEAFVKVDISVSEASTDQILTNILARVDVNDKDDRENVINKILNYSTEDKVILYCLIMNEKNVCTLLNIMPFLKPRTVSSFVRSLLGVVAEVCVDPIGSVFIQKFLRHFIRTEMVDLLLEEVLANLNILVFDDVGTWVVQDVIKHDDQVMELFKQEIELFLLLHELQSKNFFSKMFITFTSKLHLDFNSTLTLSQT